MANPTTNYSFAMPTNTDLVKDLPADFDIFGQAVDDRIKALNPSTTLGDIEYRSSTANTNTRLGIGSTGDVLTVAGGVPSWATPSSGGMTLISTTTLSGASTTLSSIPQTYNLLYLIITGYTSTGSDGRLRCLPNNVDNLANYNNQEKSSISNRTNSAIRLNELQHSKTDANNAWVFSIDNYTSAASYKPFNFYGFFVETGLTDTSINGAGVFRSNTAITSLVFDNNGFGDFTAGTILLYGVK